MNKLLPLICFICFVCIDARPQKLLFHKNRYRQAIYKTGDIIAFRLNGDQTKFSGEIKGFLDSLIVFQDFMVNPKNISHLYVDKKTKNWFILRYKYEKIFLLAGLGFGVADVVNTGEFDGDTWMVSGALIGAGLIAKLIVKDTIRIKGRRKVLILH